MKCEIEPPRGVHPHNQWCISTYFRFPPLFWIFLILGINFLTFPKKMDVSSTKISDDPFSSHWLWIPNFPLFSLKTLHFPLFQDICYFLLLLKFSAPDFVKFTRLSHTLRVFRFPLVWPWCIYASHNARTGCPAARAMRWRHGAGRGAPVNFGRRRRARRSKEIGGCGTAWTAKRIFLKDSIKKFVLFSKFSDDF